MDSFGAEQLPQIFSLELRRRRLTAVWLANESRLGYATVRRILKGSRHEPEDATLGAMVEAFGWKWDWLNKRAEIPEDAPILAAISPSIAGRITPESFDPRIVSGQQIEHRQAMKNAASQSDAAKTAIIRRKSKKADQE